MRPMSWGDRRVTCSGFFSAYSRNLLRLGRMLAGRESFTESETRRSLVAFRAGVRTSK